MAYFLDLNNRDIKLFLSEVRKTKVLTLEEERELGFIIQNGTKRESEKASQRLVNANMRFLVRTVKSFYSNSLSFLDLVSEATIGMMKATKAFDPSKGRFITISVRYMRDALNEAIQTKDRTIDLPINQDRLLKRIIKAKDKFYKINCYEASDYIISDMLSTKEKPVTVEAINECILASQGINSVDKSFGTGEEEGTMVDVYENTNSPKPDRDTTQSDFNLDLARTLKKLSEKDAYIITHALGLFGNEIKSKETIAEEMGYKCDEIIRQRLVSSLAMLGSNDRAILLKKY